MPKKHLPKFLKPQVSLHYTSHASSSSSSSSQNASAAATKDQSVNDLLAHLRISQPNTDAPRRPISIIPSVPPSLQQILVNAEPPPPPRPRAQVGVPRRNRIPGPPPPASWLVVPTEVSEESTFQAQAHDIGHADTHRLPDLPHIAPRRLAHAALVAVAQNWDFHVVYDQHYLYTLRPGLKSLLISCITAHNPAALKADHLRILFRDGDDDDFTHLDLSRALGPGLTFKDLRSLFHQEKGPAAAASAVVADDWDVAASTAVGRARFASVTHLSLAWPAASEASWARLIAFVQYVPTITHLSLAGWAHPGGPGVLRRFARLLLCLKWLDVSGCPAAMYEGLREVEWDRAWRGVETVLCAQGEETPEGIREERGKAVTGLRAGIKKVRAEVGGRWCAVVG